MTPISARQSAGSAAATDPSAGSAPPGDEPRPLLSVLMPSFNSASYIARSIESVLAIDGVDVELLIQDGLSTDETASVVASIDDPRVRLVSTADQGQSDALNHALARARGEWIGWLNADDVYDAAAVGRIAGMLGPELDFVYGDYGTIDHEGLELKRYRSSRPFSTRRLLRYGVYVNCSAGFYRADFLRETGGLDPGLHYCMDYDLLLRIAKRSPRTLYIPSIVMRLRSHADAKTSTSQSGFVEESWRVQRRHAAGVPGGHLLAALGSAIFRAYLLTLPIWQTRLWRRIRPGKQL